MKKFLVPVLLIFVFCSVASAVEQTPEMKKMSVFISNFTEAGLFNFDLEADDNGDEEEGEYIEPKVHLGNPANVTELIRFGIVHNLLNNFLTRIENCKDKNCEAGDLTIDKKFVFESVKKYFDIDLNKNKKISNIIKNDPSVVFSFDGNLFHFAADSFREPGNDKIYYAEVQGVTQRGKNLMLAGDIYNSKKFTDRPGMFAATIREIKYQGKKTWVIVDMTTDWVTNSGRD